MEETGGPPSVDIILSYSVIKDSLSRFYTLSIPLILAVIVTNSGTYLRVKSDLKSNRKIIIITPFLWILL